MAVGGSKTNTFYTTRQVAELLGVSAPTVIKWVEEGRLHAHRTPGGHRRISAEALRAFSAEGPRYMRAVSEDSGEGTRRVLIVDPEHDYSDLVAEYFRMQDGVEVLQAVDPLTVGYIVGALCPDVVVFDVSCPRIHVREIVKMVSEQRGMRVLLLSSSWSGELRGITDEYSEATAVQKPVKLDQLWTLVKS